MLEGNYSIFSPNHMLILHITVTCGVIIVELPPRDAEEGE